MGWSPHKKEAIWRSCGPWHFSRCCSQAVDTSTSVNHKTTLGEGLGRHIFQRNSCPLSSSPCMAFLLLDKIVSVTLKGPSNP